VRGTVGPRRKTVEAASVEEIDRPLDAYG
jgi:hypothetical protein